MRATVTIGIGLALGLATGCGSGSSSKGSTNNGSTAQTGQLVATAGVEPLRPSQTAQVSSGGLGRLGLSAADVGQVYEMTTPAGEAIAFNVFAREAGNSGDVRVSIAHVADGGAAPVDPPSVSLVEAGVVPSGGGLEDRDPWLDAQGDGFARLTLRGAISREQVYAVQVETSRGVETALFHIAIGARSSINVDMQTEPPAPFVVDDRTLYSSDSWMFGLPTCATSGDRTTIVVYEGDEGDRFSPNRYELRLQYDATTGAVTGGASQESSPDHGNWRDHEIAALFNVLAVVQSGDQDVSVRLSYDRGATFTQTETLAVGLPQFRQRLVQIAMADDYTLAVLFWQAAPDFRSELVLVEGSPSALDANGSPTRYSFSAPVVIHRTADDVTPAIMGAAYSSGGDLVLGYGFTRLEPSPNGQAAMRSEYRCATRLFGETTFHDVLVDEDINWNFDPSVSLLGQGQGLNVFFAYEAADGVRLAHSGDAGRTFSSPRSLGGRWSNLPSVIAVDTGGRQRVDLLYLDSAAEGQELHLARWDDFAAGGAPAEYRLTQAQQVSGPSSMQVTQVSWLGYDACLDGNDVVVVYHEATTEVVAVPIAAPAVGVGAPTAASAGGFTAASPPPLAPGLTGSVPAPDPADDHQLRLLRLD